MRPFSKKSLCVRQLANVCMLLFIFMLLFMATAPLSLIAESNRISHGPMLGRPGATSMSVWARTEKPGMFRVRYGLQPGKFELVSEMVVTSPKHDHTGVANLKNLTPDTRYYYQVETAGGAKGESGSFRTLPDLSLHKDPKLNPQGLFNFSFEYACGNKQNLDKNGVLRMPSFDTLNRQVKDKVHFAILNGDWVYEELRSTTPAEWARDTGAKEIPDILNKAPNLAGVWTNYRLYLDRAANLRKWHRHVPSYYTFDDHELLNDIYGTAHAGFRNRQAVFRDIGLQGWYDYLGWSNPLATTQGIHFGEAEFKKGSDILIDPKADFTKIDLKQAANLHVHWGTRTAGEMDLPSDQSGDMTGVNPNAMVYDIKKIIDKNRIQISPPALADGKGKYSIGRHSYGTYKIANCRFFLLDTRSHRDMHDLSQRDKPGVSMLGDAQREWMKNWMLKKDADFYFMVSTVNFMVPHVGRGGGGHFDTATKDDAWTAFMHERESLIKFWDTLDKPVFVLTGDLHNSFAIKITDKIWEFASGPHASYNHRPQDEAFRPVNGPFKYGPRTGDIRWSTTALPDIPRENRTMPHYCVVQINNVFNNPLKPGDTRYVAYPIPHVIFKYFDGRTGELRYAESVHAK